MELSLSYSVWHYVRRTILTLNLYLPLTWGYLFFAPHITLARLHTAAATAATASPLSEGKLDVSALDHGNHQAVEPIVPDTAETGSEEDLYVLALTFVVL